MTSVPVAIHPVVFKLFPGLRIIVLEARGIQVKPEMTDQVKEKLGTAWAKATNAAIKAGNSQNHPHIAPWRTRFAAMGVSAKKYTISAENTLRRASKGGAAPFINPLVSAFHTSNPSPFQCRYDC